MPRPPPAPRPNLCMVSEIPLKANGSSQLTRRHAEIVASFASRTSGRTRSGIGQSPSETNSRSLPVWCSASIASSTCDRVSRSRSPAEEVGSHIEDFLEPRRRNRRRPHRDDAKWIRGVSEQDDLDRRSSANARWASARADALAHTSFRPPCSRSAMARVHRARFLLSTPQLVDQEGSGSRPSSRTGLPFLHCEA